MSHELVVEISGQVANQSHCDSDDRLRLEWWENAQEFHRSDPHKQLAQVLQSG